MTSSIFVSELSEMSIEDIKSFCNQGFSEGLRIEYKRDFPKNLKLAETICAFANTEGGIILIGVQADKMKNKPIGITGIELKDGLEERVVNICLSHISPTVRPEVRVCDYKSDRRKNESDKAVLIVRIRSSPIAPHYLLNNNRIMVRVHDRNSLADLRTIESLLDRRESFEEGIFTESVFFQGKKIDIESETFESVVVAPQFRLEPFIHFYDRENADRLFEISNEVMSLHKHRPDIYHLDFVALNPSNNITRWCRIERYGKVIFQRSVVLDKGRLNLLEPLDLLIKTLKAIQKIYAHFGYYGDLIVGLTIVNTQNLLLGFPARRPMEKFRCEEKQIHVHTALRYDELCSLTKVVENIFQMLCVHFRAILPQKITEEIVSEILSRYE